MLKSADALLIDLDGVVWVGSRPVEENVEAIKILARRGHRILFLTNNSTRSRRSYSEILSGLGIPAGPEEVVTSGLLASQWILLKKGPLKILPLGEEGLVEELVLSGHAVLSPSDYRLAQAVVVGLDRGLTYQRLRAAVRAVLGGALFVATNEDDLLPAEDGPDPGAGSLVAAIEAATGRVPDFVAGKPNPWAVDYVVERHGLRREVLVVVGDRIDTDMELARRAMVRGVLVLTGIARGPVAVESGGFAVVRSLKDLL